ncbi:expressed unknown protein [Seminavis robusta]|uniref:Uncharacterized protein n=1 Tax=Seminavis robusta TaxID=568900 RepID=A0A9N8HEZ0_9STRA|nr:expressed unknown protein [Seminavis robusta]|eukprot:Sro433_g141810.1 n/a (192) ;mRNA; f:26526-27101
MTNQRLSLPPSLPVGSMVLIQDNAPGHSLNENRRDQLASSRSTSCPAALDTKIALLHRHVGNNSSSKKNASFGRRRRRTRMTTQDEEEDMSDNSSSMDDSSVCRWNGCSPTEKQATVSLPKRPRRRSSLSPDGGVGRIRTLGGGCDGHDPFLYTKKLRDIAVARQSSGGSLSSQDDSHSPQRPTTCTGKAA